MLLFCNLDSHQTAIPMSTKLVICFIKGNPYRTPHVQLSFNYRPCTPVCKMIGILAPGVQDPIVHPPCVRSYRATRVHDRPLHPLCARSYRAPGVHDCSLHPLCARILPCTRGARSSLAPPVCTIANEIKQVSSTMQQRGRLRQGTGENEPSKAK